MLRFPVKNQGLDPANKFGTDPQYSCIILCYLKCLGCSQDIDKGLLGLPGAGSVGTAHPDEIPLVQTKDDFLGGGELSTTGRSGGKNSRNSITKTYRRA